MSGKRVRSDGGSEVVGATLGGELGARVEAEAEAEAEGVPLTAQAMGHLCLFSQPHTAWATAAWLVASGQAFHITNIACCLVIFIALYFC